MSPRRLAVPFESSALPTKDFKLDEQALVLSSEGLVTGGLRVSLAVQEGFSAAPSDSLAAVSRGRGRSRFCTFRLGFAVSGR